MAEGLMTPKVPYERNAAGSLLQILSLALREQADAADRVAVIAFREDGGDAAYPDELPEFDRLAQTCGTLRAALHVLRTGPGKSIDTRYWKESK